jgi:hypothetical protein
MSETIVPNNVDPLVDEDKLSTAPELGRHTEEVLAELLNNPAGNYS